MPKIQFNNELLPDVCTPTTTNLGISISVSINKLFNVFPNLNIKIFKYI